MDMEPAASSPRAALPTSRKRPQSQSPPAGEGPSEPALARPRFEGNLDPVLSLHDKELSLERKMEAAINAYRNNKKLNMTEEGALAGAGGTRLLTQPSCIKVEMRDYQLEGLNWLIRLHENGSNGILADEMGLGKTLQCISLLGYLLETEGRTAGPHLIVVQKFNMGSWMDEIKRFCPSLHAVMFWEERNKDLKNIKLDPAKFDVCVTTFYKAIHEKKLSKIDWHYIIIDEAQRNKNEFCTLSETLLSYKSIHRLLITGSPIKNNLHELWSQLSFVEPKVFETFEDCFEISYRKLEKNCGSDSDSDSGGNDSAETFDQLEVAQKIYKVVSPFLLRRLKSDVETSLPPKKETILMVGLSPMQKEYYRLLELDEMPNPIMRRKKLNRTFQLEKSCNHPYLFEGAEPGFGTGEDIVENSAKMVLLDKMLPKLKERGSRVLICSQMPHLLNILDDYLRYRKYQYCRIDGNARRQECDAVIDAFNKQERDEFVFLLSTKAGGVGINLAIADVVILYGSNWNPWSDLQAQDRAHRIGQKKEVQVFRFCTKDTIEVKVIREAYKKQAWSALVIEQGRSAEQKTVNKDDLQVFSYEDRTITDEYIDGTIVNLREMAWLGAVQVFSSEDGSLTDEDIERIIAKGEEPSAEPYTKLKKFRMGDFKFDGKGTFLGDDKEPPAMTSTHRYRDLQRTSAKSDPISINKEVKIWTEEEQTQFCEICAKLKRKGILGSGLITHWSLGLDELLPVLNKLREELPGKTEIEYKKKPLIHNWNKLRQYYQLVIGREQLGDGKITSDFGNSVQSHSKKFRDLLKEGPTIKVKYFHLLEYIFGDMKSGSHSKGEDPSLEEAENSTNDFEPHDVTESPSSSITCLVANAPTIPAEDTDEELGDVMVTSPSSDAGVVIPQAKEPVTRAPSSEGRRSSSVPKPSAPVIPPTQIDANMAERSEISAGKRAEKSCMAEASSSGQRKVGSPSLGKQCGFAPKKLSPVNKKRALSPKKGILKRPAASGCKGLCMCLDCRLRADETIGYLLEEVSSLRTQASRVEEVARELQRQMRHGPKRVKFAQNVEDDLSEESIQSDGMEDDVAEEDEDARDLSEFSRPKEPKALKRKEAPTVVLIHEETTMERPVEQSKAHPTKKPKAASPSTAGFAPSDATTLYVNEATERDAALRGSDELEQELKESRAEVKDHKKLEDVIMQTQDQVQEVVLLDGDARHSESTDKTTNKRHEMKIYYPSSEHPQSVELSHDDIKCLDPESLLSSPIMNFYIMYLQQPMSSISTPRGKYHIFNTYFFSKLEALASKADKASYFLKLRGWWKGIDIFQKAYVLLPVHADTHWSLVIICIPSKEDQSGPIILHLDSLKFHRSTPIFSAIERFLKEEWIYLNKNRSLSECPLQEMVWKKLPRKIEKETIPVPQQENDYDCGLFVLYYMQRFIEEAPERLRKKDLSMFGERWFQPEEASALRKKMQTLLLELFEEAKPDNTTSEQQTTCQSLGEAKPKNDVMETTMSEQPLKGRFRV